MKKFFFAIQSLASLGIFGVFSIFCIGLIGWSVYNLDLLNQTVEKIFHLTDEINLFASVEVKLLNQQLAEEAVVGELLSNTPFDTREELEEWLELASQCQDDQCLDNLTQGWLAEETSLSFAEYLFDFTNSTIEDIYSYCVENNSLPGCDLVLSDQFTPENFEILIELGNLSLEEIQEIQEIQELVENGELPTTIPDEIPLSPSDIPSLPDPGDSPIPIPTKIPGIPSGGGGLP